MKLVAEKAYGRAQVTDVVLKNGLYRVTIHVCGHKDGEEVHWNTVHRRATDASIHNLLKMADEQLDGEARKRRIR